MSPDRPAGRAAIVAAVLVGLLAAGCGGTAPPPPPPPPPTAAAPPSAPAREVRDAFEAYGAAQLRRDFAAACMLLTERARQTFIAGIAAGGSTDGITCEAGFGEVYGQEQLAAAFDQATRSIAIVSVDVQGDRAAVEYSTANRRSTAQLVREGGAWRIDEAG